MTHRTPLLAIGVASLAGAAIALVLAAAPRGEAARRCVGMFVDPERIPCRDRVLGWAGQGIFRVFDDGTVETLVSPMPPCPEGDFFLWVRYPG